jgi:alpha-amylase
VVDLPPGKPENGVFVHLFEWRWSDIAQECETYLGPSGFAAVQVSPPNEHALIGTHPWWQRYQPVSYTLASRSGSPSEFAAMVARCANAGVAVYVDAVLNHMTGQSFGIGSNGTEFSKYEYPDLYSSRDFHAPVCTITGSDYTSNADNVRNCELLSLSDLNTGAPAVQQKLADYLIGLVELGVRGFRIDAAKHMAPSDLDAILNQVSVGVSPQAPPYYFFEVIDYGGEAIASADYLGVGSVGGNRPDVTEFKYSGVGSKFLGENEQTLSELADLGEGSWGLLPSERAVVFTNNHDTQRGEAIFYQDGPSHELANIFMLAWPYGYPKIMSSFAFERTSDAGRSSGPPSDAAGTTDAIYMDGEPSCAPERTSAAIGQWVCEHRAPYIAQMIAFRAETAALPVANWWDDGGNRIAFGRGDRGFVVINGELNALSETLTTGLPAGEYCDVIGGAASASGCTGAAITVDESGRAAFTVPLQQAVAIHVGARD